MRKILTYIVIGLLLSSCGIDSQPGTLFSKLDKSTTGVNFRNLLKPTEKFNIIQYAYFYNGAGVALGDLNNDGFQDIVFTGNMVKNRLYINQGNFKFEDITEKAGIAEKEGWCTGVNIVDINTDGLLDIYICRSGYPFEKFRKNLLYINNGDLTFEEKAMEYGLDDPGYSTQSAFFDYDGDGDLDMFLANQSTPEYARGNLEVIVLRKKQIKKMGNKLFKNVNGKFIDVSDSAGIQSNVLTFSLGLNISDFNNDGWPDIYVGNDFSEPDYLYINNQDGTFSDESESYFDHISLYSMGADVADFNNDGLLDLITLDMLPESNHLQKMHAGAENYDKAERLIRNGFHKQYSRNMLQLNNGDGTFSEMGEMAGVSNTDWSWSPLFADFDNDGYKDLFVSNGYVKDYTDMDFVNYSFEKSHELKASGSTDLESFEEYIAKMPENEITNYLFRNTSKGQFQDVSKAWGITDKSISQGAVYGDLDNDGDLDLVMNNSNDFAHIYRNNSRDLSENNYLNIKLTGEDNKLEALGSIVLVYSNNTAQTLELMPTRGFQSSGTRNLHFGLGSSEIVDSLIVTWPDQSRQKLANIDVNQFLTINKSSTQSSSNVSVKNDPIFNRNDGIINYIHNENSFIDFKQQRLIPNFLSRSGPCITKGDVNADGYDDLYIGGAKGQPGKLFVASQDGNYKPWNSSVFLDDAISEDTDASLIDIDKDGDLDLYVVSGGNEFDPNSKYLQDRLYLNNGSGIFSKTSDYLPSIFESGSCITSSDFDQDGDVDLFIGSRLVPNKYPETPRSHMLINDGTGRFNIIDSYIHLEFLGMITDAEFIDINQDSRQDLVIVGDWMPIKVFINTQNSLEDKSSDYIKFKSAGWWNTIHTDDFDGDGDPDLLLGNLGRNTQIKVSIDKPASIYFDDFNSDNQLDPIMCYYVGDHSYPMVSRDDLLSQLNHLKKKFVTYKDYADATINDIIDINQVKSENVLYAYMGESIYLQNDSSHFNLISLPDAIQIAPVHAFESLDLNNDGHKDIIAAGNNTHTRLKLGPYDSNHGIVLLGNGNGQFQELRSTESGLNVRGNTRFILRINHNNERRLLFGVNNDSIQAYSLSN